MHFRPCFYEEMGRDVCEENVLSPNKNRAQFMESECIQVYGIEEFQFSAFITEKKNLKSL